MRRTIWKWFWVWNYDKEEKWLNDMSAIGLQLSGVGYCRYELDTGMPDEYVYRLEFLKNHPHSAESLRYIKFLEETGVEYIGYVFRMVYFRKRADDVGFDIYSDIDSRIKHLSRLLLLIGIGSGLNIIIGAINLLGIFIPGHGNLGSIGIINLTLGVLCAYGFLRIFLKYRKLKKEKLLHE